MARERTPDTVIGHGRRSLRNRVQRHSSGLKTVRRGKTGTYRFLRKDFVMTATSVLTAILVGVVIGVLGRLVVPGRQRIGVILTVLIGIGAALLGSLIVRNLGVVDTGSGDWIELAVQVVLAAIGVAGASALFGRQETRTVRRSR